MTVSCGRRRGASVRGPVRPRWLDIIALLILLVLVAILLILGVPAYGKFMSELSAGNRSPLCCDSWIFVVVYIVSLLAPIMK